MANQKLECGSKKHKALFNKTKETHTHTHIAMLVHCQQNFIVKIGAISMHMFTLFWDKTISYFFIRILLLVHAYEWLHFEVGGKGNCVK